MSRSSEPILSVEELTTQFNVAGGPVKAVDDNSFTLDHGETLGIVGESTLAEITTHKRGRL